ncbi:MAG: HD domain-containing protein [Gemmatimonadota bacterium]|nr:HD domain-containing protein [Gemmatimonadota bacterium]
MMPPSEKETFEREQPIPRHASDAVLSDLSRVEEDYRAFRDAFERQATELRESREEVAVLHHAVDRHRHRAEQFRHALVDIQRATLGGDVYALVLQSCMTLTGAQRGVYLKTTGQDIRVEASVGVGSSPLGGAPSTFVEALARRVLERDDAVVCGGEDTRDLPAPAENDHFQTCAAIPVAMRGDQHGVIVVFDKDNGEFDETDLETLLHVGDQATVAVDNAQLQRELEQAYLGTVGMLADAVETKDPYTRGHCEQVSQFALGMAHELGLDERTRETVCLAALLHDVGKICISDGILNKPGPLLPEEREVVKAHARIGAELMRNMPALDGVAMVVRHHHEHFDGRGYPDGLAGEAIPIGSRIVAVIDAYCAMIDRRSYKEALGEAASRAELLRCAGTQFEPALVDAFLRVLDAQTASGRPATLGCGILPQVRRHREDTIGATPRRRGI